MKIEVTAEDIRIGKPGSQCPIALAIRGATGKYAAIGVTRFWFVADETTNEISDADYKFPDVVVDFIRRFDSGQPVEPFSFEVNLIVESNGAAQGSRLGALGAESPKVTKR